MANKVIVICGPTASGKTALGVALAKALNGEVVSADSMQIYRGMDIGTAKPTIEEMEGIPHHMIDVADPAEDFSAARYVEMAAPCVDGILIRPGETFSFWRLVGRCTAKRGYLPGMVLQNGVPKEGVGGGMCQFTNLLHWMALHTDLTITERHHHDDYDLFPDFGRQVPFGVGTSILYNYLDYRLRNDTGETYQILVHSDGTYLRGELRCTAPSDHVWHISCEEEYFSREMDGWYRNNKVFRRKVDKNTGNTLDRALLQQAHARVLYDESYIDPAKKKGC